MTILTNIWEAEWNNSTIYTFRYMLDDGEVYIGVLQCLPERTNYKTCKTFAYADKYPVKQMIKNCGENSCKKPISKFVFNTIRNKISYSDDCYGKYASSLKLAFNL